MQARTIDLFHRDLPLPRRRISFMVQRTGVVTRALLRHKSALAGSALLLFFLTIALLANHLSPYNPLEQDLPGRLSPPSSSHLLGTDDLGRDLLSRIMHGARISLTVGLASVTIALSLGVFLGSIAGYYGGRVDMILMRIVEIMMSFPSILLAIGIVAILGPALHHAMIAIGIVAIPVYARLTRACVLTVKELDYVLAARAVGLTDARILFSHILPNCLPPLLVQASLGIASAILDAAGLSFLGLGAQPPTPEWGAILTDTVKYLQTAPWVVIFPGIAIMGTVMGFNLLGDGLREALDPRMKKAIGRT